MGNTYGGSTGALWGGSVYGNEGTPNIMATEFRVLTPPAYALEFGGIGTDNHVDVGDVIDADQFWFSFWFRADSLDVDGNNNYRHLIHGADHIVVLEESSTDGVGSITFRVPGVDTSIFSANEVITVGELAYVVVVYDGSDRIIYVDSDEKNRETIGSGTVDLGSLSFGGLTNGSTSNTLDGLFLEIRYGVGVPSDAEIEARNITTGIVSKWGFDEGSGSTATDSVGANDGTISGASYVATGSFDAGPDIDTDVYDVDPLKDTFSRFASEANLRFIDPTATKKDTYPYGTRAEVQYSTDTGQTWNTRLATIVGDTTRTTRDGLPSVETDHLAYDHLLRRRKIYKTYSSTSLSSILNDLITNFTSVTWNASNVTVQDDATVTREFKGDRVDEAIAWVAARSANEEWGVNDQFEFFFQQQDISRAPAVRDTDVIDYDLPEKGKQNINRFKLFYGSSGSNFVTVQDLESQRDLKEKLDTSSNVVISDSDTLPEISNEDTAKAIAEQMLGEQSVIQTGTITLPLGRFNTNAGDVLELTISDAGIDSTDFRVAQIEYRWQAGETVLTIAENTATNIEGLLVGLSDSVENVRARAADTSATGTDFITVQSGATLSIDVTLTTKTESSGAFLFGQSDFGDTLGGGVSSTSSVTVESKKATTNLLNLCRDLWQGASFTDLTHLAVGTDDSAATRSDVGLQAEIDRVSVEKFGEGDSSTKFEFTATVPAGGAFGAANGLQELSIQDAASGGNLYLRSTFDATTIDASTRLKIHIEVTLNDDQAEQGVVTITGQERLVDLLTGDTTAHEPSRMAYGTGTTNSTESDTAPENQVHQDTLDSQTDKQTGLTTNVERIGTGEANGNDITELVLENAADEALARIVMAAYPKTNSAALESDYRTKFSNA